MSFRNRLYLIKDEAELRDYFNDNAGLVDENLYQCAGVFASDTAELFETLKKAWKYDKTCAARELLKRYV